MVSVTIPTLLTRIVHLKMRVMRSSQGNNTYIFSSSSSRSSSIVISSPHFGWIEDWNRAPFLSLQPERCTHGTHAWNWLELLRSTECISVFRSLVDSSVSLQTNHASNLAVLLKHISKMPRYFWFIVHRQKMTELSPANATTCRSYKRVEQRTIQLYISDVRSLFEHLAMVVALSRWRNVRSKWPPTFIATGRYLSKRHTTRRDGSESPRPCWYFWCFWCAASWKTKKRDISCFLLWWFMPWKSSKRCKSVEVSLFFIFHFVACWHISTILRCTNGRIADVFPLPFWYVIIDDHAGWALSGMEFMNYCWVVGERLSQASIILKRRNQDGQERVSSIFGPYIHTDLPRSCIDHDALSSVQ